MTAARIPADVDQEDRVLAGLTARQLAILAVTAVVVWLVVFGGRGVVPVPILVAAAVPAAGLGAALALGRRDGLSGDRFAIAALAYRREPRRRVLAPRGVPPLPPWLEPAGGEPARPLDLPLRGLGEGGVVDLGGSGSAVLARATPVNLSLRSESEQDALVAAFGRFLHALGTPVQVVARAQRVDLSPLIAKITGAAASLPAAGLTDAAVEHAEFLASLGARRDLLRRETLVVLSHHLPPPEAADLLVRRLEEAASLLQASGVALHPLGREEAAALLRRCADPDAEPLAAADPALPTEPVRRAS